MATLQLRVDDKLKTQSDALFASLGMDTSTAIRIFLTSAVENKGLPFAVQHRQSDYSLAQAVSDTRTRTNLHGPYTNASDAVASMLED
jgi:DNA-damage-inducible protein J